MADTCASLAAEIAALRAEVARIPKVDERRIIQSSVAEAQNLIVPLIGTIVLLQLAPVKAAITAVEGTLAAVAASAASAASAAAGAATTAAAAVAKLAGLAASIAAVLGVIATLQILGSRIDAVENGFISLGNDVSKTLGLLLAIKNIAISADNKADTANKKITQVLAFVEPLPERINQADSKATEAKRKAGEADNNATEAKRKAGEANSKASEANSKASEASSKASEANSKASEANSKASEANSKASEASSKASEAKRAIPPIERTAGQAKNTADEALKKINNSPKGGKGDPGKPGERGLQGIPGKDGKPGERGLQGIPGKDGKPGERGLQGIPGKDGKPGERGLQGIPGKDGKDGKFNVAELSGINAQLSNIATNLNGINAGVIANGQAIKKVPIEVIQDNRRLATDVIPSKMQEAFCQELENGKCFPGAMDSWMNNQPLAKVPQKVDNLQTLVPQMKAITPVIVNTGNIVNTTNNNITQLGNTVTNVTNQVNKIDNKITNVTNQITKVDNKITNVTNQITKVDNKINNVTNQITKVDNKINNVTNQITKVDNKINNVTNQITNVNTQVTNLTNQITKVDTQVTNITNQVNKVDNKITNITNTTTQIQGQVNNINTTVINIDEKECECPDSEECVLTLPERYQIPVDGHIPQLILVFREVFENDTWGERMYPMTIPHPKSTTPPENRPLSDYQKGSWELMLTLKDNTKVFINALSMAECQRMIDQIKPLVADVFLENSFQKIGQRQGQQLLEVKVRIFKVDYYAKGTKNAKPSWSKYFRN
ncbi:hypothetical protein LC613_13780 [Nostoc sphaeroides CHAB 2801]|uniref:hypothetical protein n=1 Tax=Nostoc sphaeroides TaxID=446679 RepID=UPI0015F3480F|nr:hypothetical protein [Nostoc sphaeroides]MCC5629086.1 hypothetical protein [Nostoc sphaeroides CHAB 2801]